MKIGIACSGLDHIRRGFETFAEGLFRLMQAEKDLDVVLFKGNGPRVPREEVLWNIPRDSGLWGGWTSFIPWKGRYVAEQTTFALSLWRRLRTYPVDVMLFSDIQIGNALRRLPRVWRIPVLLFSNGGPFPARNYRGFDFIHQVTPGAFREALSQGVPAERMAMVPYGVNTTLFSPNAQIGREFRSLIGIEPDAYVILSVGALETRHKRMDWLIREVSSLATKPHLVLCGEYKANESAEVAHLGNRLLGSRFHLLRLEYRDMPAAYNAANVFVLCSLKEGFGRAFLESLACGVPVIHHADDDMEWIVGRGGLSVDMGVKGKLASTLWTAIEDAGLRSQLSMEARSRALDVFSDQQLLPRYAEMFERARVQSGKIAA